MYRFGTMEKILKVLLKTHPNPTGLFKSYTTTLLTSEKKKKLLFWLMSGN